MNMIFIVPAKGMTIPAPDSPDMAITEAGCWVPDNKFYRGFVNRGEAKKTSPKKQSGKSHNVADKE